MGLTEKSAYIKGLAEGLKLDESKPETKLINEMISLIDEMTKKINQLDEDVDDLSDYIEEIDEDLGEVEECCYGDEDDECDCCDDDNEFYEVTCPSCGAKVCLDENADPNDIVCPKCGEHFDCVCDECDCDECAGEDDGNNEGK